MTTVQGELIQKFWACVCGYRGWEFLMLSGQKEEIRKFINYTGNPNPINSKYPLCPSCYRKLEEGCAICRERIGAAGKISGLINLNCKHQQVFKTEDEFLKEIV